MCVDEQLPDLLGRGGDLDLHVRCNGRVLVNGAGSGELIQPRERDSASAERKKCKEH
jgi:hypothetical protein